MLCTLGELRRLGSAGLTSQRATNCCSVPWMLLVPKTLTIPHKRATRDMAGGGGARRCDKWSYALGVGEKRGSKNFVKIFDVAYNRAGRGTPASEPCQTSRRFALLADIEAAVYSAHAGSLPNCKIRTLAAKPSGGGKSGSAAGLRHLLGRTSGKLATAVLGLVVQKFAPGFGERILLAMDDSPTARYGRHVEGAGVHHNLAWFMQSLVGLGVTAKVWLATDGACATRPFLLPVLKMHIVVVSRLRKDACLFDLPGPERVVEHWLLENFKGSFRRCLTSPFDRLKCSLLRVSAVLCAALPPASPLLPVLRPS